MPGMPVLGAIADDLTGATDLALTLSRGGMQVRQVVGPPDAETDFGGADAVVVALKSRTIPAEAAVAQSRASAEVLLARGARQILFKYCSTFDSTDRGNIGPVIGGLMEMLGESRTLACPAFPTAGRTVYQGHLFVGNQLLSDSSMKDHPLTPMRDSRLVQVLSRQTTLPVHLVDLGVVRSGTEELRAALDSRPGIAIVDAIAEDDLYRIAAAAGHFRLITGGSGVALGLPAFFGFTPRDDAPVASVPAGRQAILAGSCSTATRRQIAAALDAGFAGLRLDPVAIAEGRQTVAEAVHFAQESDRTPVIYASADSDEVARSQKILGVARAGAAVEAFLAALARDLADGGFGRLIIAGGETSGAVIDGLGIKALSIGHEIDPGVPWMHSERDGAPIALVLKSGNFGAPDIFLKAWSML